MSLLRRGATGVRTPKQRAGAAAEDAAARHLEQHGCRILARNVRFRDGELDIVAQQGSLLLFVEVRLRQSERFGGAAASVDALKRRRLLRAAQQFLLRQYGQGTGGDPRGRRTGGWPACRFDVITADAHGISAWIQDAFQASE